MNGPGGSVRRSAANLAARHHREWQPRRLQQRPCPRWSRIGLVGEFSIWCPAESGGRRSTRGAVRHGRESGPGKAPRHEEPGAPALGARGRPRRARPDRDRASLGLDRDRRADPDPDPVAGPTSHAATVTTGPAVTTTTAPPPAELPRGGRRLFPRYRVVGFYGMQNLDALGAGPPDVVGRRLLEVARRYATPGDPVMPMFELIATIAHRFPTPSGLYRTRQEDEIVQQYLEAVRRINGILVLDVRPGRADFVDEMRHWEPYLRRPDVGVALDPEFSMGPGQVPGRQLGRASAAAINRASAYVAGVVRRHRLPQKLFMVHQFRDGMIHDKARVATRPGLAMTWNADGFGVRWAKLEDYRSYTRDRRFHPGLKLFYENDVDLMTPREVLRLEPRPRVVNYQ